MCFCVDGVLGVLINPKWRIIFTHGHIATLFGTFLELPKRLPNMDPGTPYLSQKYFRNYKGNPEHIFKHIILHITTFLEIKKMRKHGHDRTKMKHNDSLFVVIIWWVEKTIAFLRWWNLNEES